MHPKSHSNKGRAVSKTFLGPLQSRALPGTNTPPCQLPVFTVGWSQPQEAPKPEPLHAVWSPNQTGCKLGVCFNRTPSCDCSFCLTRCKERTQDWQSADLASCLSLAPCVTLDESLKHSGPNLQLYKMHGPGHNTFSSNCSWWIRPMNTEIIWEPEDHTPVDWLSSLLGRTWSHQIKSGLFESVRCKI